MARVALAAILVVASTSAVAAQPQTATLAAWQQFVQRIEETNRIEASRRTVSHDGVTATGRTIRIPSGTISQWRGSVFIPDITLDRVLDRLMWPGTPPPQEDVVASRVLARNGSTLRVYMRLVRRAIVTATYDTEHEMTFTRRSPMLATARSIATRIEEVGGDRGFLWKLHSYWRYEQIGDGVLVEVESLTLSRDVPSIVRSIAMPIVDRIARESIVRTLEAVRRYCEAGGNGGYGASGK
jgi:hypothetical protein